jgi:cell fate regulator YaaT (PSP1 superfamily)
MPSSSANTKSPTASKGCASGGCSSSGGCATGGCNQLNSYDWLAYEGLANLYPPTPLCEVRFKGGRKEFFLNQHLTGLISGDAVVVDMAGSTHVGHLALMGPMAELQLRKKKLTKEGLKTILRKAQQADIQRLTLARNRELPTLYRARQIIQGLELDMKLSDVEFHADNSKAVFYYSSEARIDFRDLVRLLATEFSCRIEMRQITLRQEAGRIGGIGVCGRELCCSTWLTDFKSVTTSAARYQNLSLNPAKLSGQCGRLKCCLNFELETYTNALTTLPKVEKLFTELGDAYLQKTDIFKRIFYFSYAGSQTWHSLTPERVLFIKGLNTSGKKAEALTLEEEENLLLATRSKIAPKKELARLDARLRDRERIRKNKARVARKNKK